MALATLQEIRKKVRRLTHTPSTSQLTDVELDQYINTFYQYDFPEHLRLFTNLIPFTFYTAPNVDTYATNNDPLTASNTLTDFKNRIITVSPPVYIDGKEIFYTQSPGEFYGIYPKNKSVALTGLVGNGVIVAFSGTLSSIPVQAGTVSFSSRRVNNSPLNLVDNGGGFLIGDGSGSINYLTGVYGLNYFFAPANGAVIKSHTFPYKPSRPQALLYYSNVFTVRPIPDDVYAVELQAQHALTDLLQTTSVPELNQWWQYIAYGAAKKVFEDRLDMGSVALITPEFKLQERLALRRTIVQQTNERTATIYTENDDRNVSGHGFNGIF